MHLTRNQNSPLGLKRNLLDCNGLERQCKFLKRTLLDSFGPIFMHKGYNAGCNGFRSLTPLSGLNCAEQQIPRTTTISSINEVKCCWSPGRSPLGFIYHSLTALQAESPPRTVRAKHAGFPSN